MMEEEVMLDCILVPMGLLVMIAYHAWLLRRIVNQPKHTVIGVNAFIRRFWVREMMEDISKNGVLAVQTLRNNIMASTLLASTATLAVSFIFTVLMTRSSSSSTMLPSGATATQTHNAFFFDLKGDRSQLIFSIKFFSIILCFLVGFLLNIQSVRYYSHASILITVPYKKVLSSQRHYDDRVEYVASTVNRAGYFWSLGLRAFYFSFPLFLWIFGPVPMAVTCIALVFGLYKLDAPKCRVGLVGVCGDCKDEEEVGIKSNVEEVLTC